MTSYDELFHSQLHDQSEQLQDLDLLSIQDPNRIRRLEFDMTQEAARSLLREALETGEIVHKRNAKRDKAYSEEIDGLVYRCGGRGQKGKKKRVLENVIVIPVRSQEKVLGVLQIANGEKQLTFTEQDLDISRLIASKLASFIVEMREMQVQQMLFKKQMEVSLLHQGLETQSVTKVLSLAN